MFKSLTKILLLLFFVSLFFYTLLPQAQAQLNIDEYSERIANQAGYQTTEVASQAYLDSTIGKSIAMVMGFLGVIFLGLIIYSGFQWMTAGGNEEKVKQARDRVIRATTGLIIVLAAYTISYFIYSTIKTGTEGGAPASEPPSGFECTYNSDCTDPSKPFCNWHDAWSNCVECLEDADCPGSQVCKTLFVNHCE